MSVPCPHSASYVSLDDFAGWREALTEHRQFLRQTFDKTEISTSQLVPEVQHESSTDLLPEFGSLSLFNPREPTTSTANHLILPTDVSPSLPVVAANPEEAANPEAATNPNAGGSKSNCII